jgi:uncharacterized protein YjiS (DUF1127 family)
MTILNTAGPNATTAPAIPRTARFLLKHIGRLLNRWISAVIRQRARQADIVVLRHFSDRELKDIGLTRGDLGEGLQRPPDIASGCSDQSDHKSKMIGFSAWYRLSRELFQ